MFPRPWSHKLTVSAISWNHFLREQGVAVWFQGIHQDNESGPSHKMGFSSWEYWPSARSQNISVQLVISSLLYFLFLPLLLLLLVPFQHPNAFLLILLLSSFISSLCLAARERNHTNCKLWTCSLLPFYKFYSMLCTCSLLKCIFFS